MMRSWFLISGEITVDEPAECISAPGSAGIEEADGLSGVWHALYAGKSVGSAHGFERRRLRGLLSLPAPCGREIGEARAHENRSRD